MSSDIPHFRRGDRNKYIIDEETGCWLWVGARSGNGYGYLKINGKAIGAHVWHWTQTNGPVPVDKELDHTCRTPTCVRPDHLELVTRTENLVRMNKHRWPQEDPDSPF